ncbi:MAG TPA: hypothetical protein VFY93_17530 [Planctomycetota bacterium]|nr:hypothetical protein [Planctomycetota bacterium]
MALLLLAAAASAGEAPVLAKVVPPAGQVSVEDAIRTGVEFLVANQNKDGSFGRRTVGRTYELWCDVPGGHQAFQGATTALCWLGLHDAPYQTEASKEAQTRCLAWLVRNAAVKRAYGEQFYNIWPYGYGIRALATALREGAPGADREAIVATMRQILKGLDRLQTHDGGWSYLDFNTPLERPTASNSFTTATVLVGLHEARAAGVDVPQKMIDRAVKYLWRNRTPDGNYWYSIGWQWRPHGPINRPQGSSMRNQACNLALHLFDPERCGTKELRLGLEQLRDNHRFAIVALRRPVPHESFYNVSGYFYLYGYQYAALVLEQVPEADRRAFTPFVAEAILKTRQPDGSFWDYPTYDYHKYYGTGYALIALSRCPPAPPSSE